MKSRSESKNGRLSAASREAVNKVLDRSIGSRGKKKQDDCAQSYDSTKGNKGKYEKGKQAVEEKLTDSVLKDSECGKIAGCDDDEMNDSDWEDCPIPSLDNTVHAYVDGNRELTIEIDDVPDAKRQKNAYRATAKDKERAELVHKVHLLCLLARGRIVDSACNDPLIQASLLSLLPSYLLKVPNLEKVTVKDIAPLLRWVRGNFAVRCTPSSEKSFRTSLAFALESRKGTAEEIGALAVALLRALKLTTRFVSVLDVASLKPGADKDESSGQNRAKMNNGIFRTSTLMVPKQQATSSYANKSSSHVENKSLCETSEPQRGNPLGSDQLRDNTVNSSCEAGMSRKSDGTRRKGDVQFEMQLAMALTATAENQQNSKVNEKKQIREITKTSHSSSVSDQVISTAIGSKKVDSSLCWAEVYCNGENMDGKWVHMDAVNGMIDAEQNVEAAAAASKISLRYVVAFASGGANDVTRRYCTKWHTIASKRISSMWWDRVLAPLRQLESGATHDEDYARSIFHFNTRKRERGVSKAEHFVSEFVKAVRDKILELIQGLEESNAERDSLTKKTDQMECYYKSLVQELEETQRQLLVELQNLTTEHSTCLYSISGAKAEMETLRQDMNEQTLRFSEKKHNMMMTGIKEVHKTSSKAAMNGRHGEHFAKAFLAELSATRAKKEKERDLLKKENQILAKDAQGEDQTTILKKLAAILKAEVEKQQGKTKLLKDWMFKFKFMLFLKLATIEKKIQWEQASYIGAWGQALFQRGEY